MSPKPEFFVYVDRRPDGSPFYVGCGRAARVKSWAPSARGPAHEAQVKRHGIMNITRDVFPAMSQRAAHHMERLLIREYRAQGFDLVNVDDGGAGTPFQPRTRRRPASWGRAAAALLSKAMQ